jgi:uncharacterized protein YhaN
MNKLIEQVKKEREEIKMKEQKANIARMLGLIEDREKQIERLKIEIEEIRKEMEESNFKRVQPVNSRIVWNYYYA